MTCYAKGQGRLAFSHGDREVVFGPDGNIEGYYDSMLTLLTNMDEAVETFLRALRPGRTVDIRFGALHHAVIFDNGEVKLDYTPNVLTARFWESVSLHWPKMTAAPSPMPPVKSLVCCALAEAGYACTCSSRSCSYCGKPAEGKYTIHRDGYDNGPEVPLCDACGSSTGPSCETIWARIARPTTPVPFDFAKYNGIK